MFIEAVGIVGIADAKVDKIIDLIGLLSNNRTNNEPVCALIDAEGCLVRTCATAKYLGERSPMRKSLLFAI